MFYNTLSKGEDGLYHIGALTDEKKRCYVQVRGLKVVEDDASEITFDLSSATGVDKIEDIHTKNIEAALENSNTWFGKQLTTQAIKKFYMKEDTLAAERIGATKIFNEKKEAVDMETVAPGTECTAFLEYAGLWFAKKAFGPTWKLVQLKINPKPEPKPEPEPEPEPESEPEPEIEAYPEQYVIEDEE
jgi:hypothetical protein